MVITSSVPFGKPSFCISRLNEITRSDGSPARNSLLWGFRNGTTTRYGIRLRKSFVVMWHGLPRSRGTNYRQAFVDDNSPTYFVFGIAVVHIYTLYNIFNSTLLHMVTCHTTTYLAVASYEDGTVRSRKGLGKRPYFSINGLTMNGCRKALISNGSESHTHETVRKSWNTSYDGSFFEAVLSSRLSNVRKYGAITTVTDANSTTVVTI